MTAIEDLALARKRVEATEAAAREAGTKCSQIALDGDSEQVQAAWHEFDAARQQVEQARADLVLAEKAARAEHHEPQQETTP